jgi:peptidoglycan/LPS O-acetylase OafA/YrhL
MTSQPREHLIPIEGLRGYLAIWVALGHGLQLSGYLSLPGPLNVLLMGSEAVALFMIVSGFVITHLLLRRNETYSEYIVRRFFRLFPIYVVCCAIGYFALPYFDYAVHHVAWQSLAGWHGYAQSIHEITTETRSNTLPHFLLHAAMLHGVVPAEWLPSAASTFLPAAWSLSLEWQFYLVAPLIIASLRSPSRMLLIIGIAAVLHVLYLSGRLGSYPVPSTLAATVGYFAVGIGSRLAYDRLGQIKTSALVYAVASAFLVWCFTKNFLALALWAAFYVHLLWFQYTPVTGRWFQIITTSRLPVFIGRSSYSLYLIHRPIQMVFAAGALSLAPTLSRPAMLAVQWGAVIVAVVVARGLYRAVESPGIELGRRAAHRIRARLETQKALT